jgi:hypothetical protein
MDEFERAGVVFPLTVTPVPVAPQHAEGRQIMKLYALALGLLVLPALGHADDVWRWTDAQGKTHYSNVVGSVPDSASPVKKTITIETSRLPGSDVGFTIAGGEVNDASDQGTRRAAATGRRASRWLPDAPRIYDDARLRYGCAVGGMLYSGGFSHPDDIAAGWNCAPYRLGPRAWLNAAKAELAVRENGIDPRQMVQLYQEYYAAPMP